MMPVSAEVRGAGDVCAVVVTFNPDWDRLQTLLRQIASQGGCFIVVDNGSARSDRLRSAIEDSRLLAFMELGENRGLAYGLNIGIQTAANLGYDTVFMFDQDSEIEQGFFSGLFQAWQDAQSAVVPIAVIGPLLKDPDTGRTSKFATFRDFLPRGNQPLSGVDGLFEADFVITSGSMISIAAFRDIGVMREDFFIDNIDLEWCFRARARGYAVLGTTRAILLHRIGEPAEGLLYRLGLVSSHPPLRFYYSTRNRLRLYREPHAPWAWVLRDCVRFALKTILLLVTSSQRLEYLRQLKRGVRDSRALGCP
jgi:rhamnosyltransferase